MFYKQLDNYSGIISWGRLSLFFIIIFIFLAGAVGIQADDSEEDYDDLSVEAITINPTKPAVNQYCQITVKIKNNGTKNLYTSNGLTSFSYEFIDFINKISKKFIFHVSIVNVVCRKHVRTFVRCRHRVSEAIRNVITGPSEPSNLPMFRHIAEPLDAGGF